MNFHPCRKRKTSFEDKNPRNKITEALGKDDKYKAHLLYNIS